MNASIITFKLAPSVPMCVITMNSGACDVTLKRSDTNVWVFVHAVVYNHIFQYVRLLLLYRSS